MSTAGKVRTFKESWQLMAARDTARGYFPLSEEEGGRYGKGNSKGRAHHSSPTSSGTSLAVQGKSIKDHRSQRPGNPTYTGCFVCGSKDHDYRACPKRGAGKV